MVRGNNHFRIGATRRALSDSRASQYSGAACVRFINDGVILHPIACPAGFPPADTRPSSDLTMVFAADTDR